MQLRHRIHRTEPLRLEEQGLPQGQPGELTVSVSVPPTWCKLSISKGQPQLAATLCHELSDEDRDNILKTIWISSCQETRLILPRHREGGKLRPAKTSFCFLTFQWDLPILQ